MMDDDERRRIERKAAARVAADLWRTIDAAMRNLEGDAWAEGTEPELARVAEGPEEGRLYWKVGQRMFADDDRGIVEMTFGDEGRPTRRRVIGRSGTVLEDEAIVFPRLN